MTDRHARHAIEGLPTLCFMRTGWHLHWQGGNLWLLTNGSGPDCTDVDVWAIGIQLDGQGRNYVRRIPSIKNGDSVELILEPAFGASSGDVHFKVNGGDENYGEILRVDLRS